MKWPILGIVAVFFLQLGFTAYNAIDRDIGEMTAVGEITDGATLLANADDGTTLLANADQDYDVPWTLISAPKSQRNVLYSRTTFVSSKRSVKAPASRSVTFEPVLIVYQTYPEIKFRTETPRVEPPVVSEAKTFQPSVEVRTRSTRQKRSIFSKSAAVIKKPYDWLRAVGSILD